jgi:hypothetical protein
LKRIVILSYYALPAPSTAANRIGSWVKYFPDSGIYPILITRDWKGKDEYERSVLKTSRIEKEQHSEVHYVPYLGNFRTKRKNPLIRKLFTLIELVLQNTFPSIIHYYHLLNYAEQYCLNNNIDGLLISGGPFQAFLVGYKIKKKKGINWFADYRDGWSVGNISYPKDLLHKFIHYVSGKYEKKWLSSSSFFSTVTDHLKNEIKDFIKINGITCYNGSNETNVVAQFPVQNNTSTLQILYSGEIYSKQDYTNFINACNGVYRNYEGKLSLVFLGTLNSNYKIDKKIYEHKKWIDVTARIPLQEALHIQFQSDVFVMFNYPGVKGIASSKMFDYLQTGKKFILFKSDNDILEEFAIKSNLGIIANSNEELASVIENLIDEKLHKGFIQSEPNWDYINQFTRENQASILANEILKHI